MLKKQLVIVLAMVLGFGIFSENYAEPPSKYCFYIAGGVTLGTVIILNDKIESGWARTGVVVGGFLVSYLVVAWIESIIRKSGQEQSDSVHNEGTEENILKIIEHLQIGSSFDGKTVYAGYHLDF